MIDAMLTSTIYLSDALDGGEEQVEQARDAYAELEAFAVDEYGSAEAAPDVVYARLQQYEQAIANHEGRANVIEQTLKRWGGPTYDEDAGTWSGDAFELEMMSGVQAAQIEDKVGAAGVALQQDVGAAPRDMPGERVVEVLDACVVGEPDGVGPADPPNLDRYPSPVMIWLYGKCNNINMAGDPDFQPTGFEAAMEDGEKDLPTNAADPLVREDS